MWDVAIVVNRGGTLSPTESAGNNGVYVANRHIAQQLQSHGKKVCLISGMEDAKDSDVDGVPIFHVDDDSDTALADCIRDHGGCDVLVENTKATAFRLPIANRHLVIMHNRHHLWGVETYGRSIYGLVQSAICVSEFSRDENIKWGLPPKLATVIPNGVDTKCFYPRDVERLPKRLIYAGYCSPRKGIHLALEAFEKLRTLGHQDLELLVCGKQSPWEPGAEFDKFERKGWLNEQRELNWHKVERDCPGVTYRGVCNANELAMEFSRSSYLVLPSRMDTFGLVAIEAQACGCVPILPVDGPFREIIFDKLCPLLHHGLNTDALVESLTMAFTAQPSEDLRTQMSETARTRFTWEQTGKRYLELIEKTPRLSKTRRNQFAFIQAAKNALHYK